MCGSHYALDAVWRDEHLRPVEPHAAPSGSAGGDGIVFDLVADVKTFDGVNAGLARCQFKGRERRFAWAAFVQDHDALEAPEQVKPL